MSVRVMSWVWDHSTASGTDLLVLLAIADNADDTGGNAWPSVATLARKCRVSDRSVQRSLRSLAAGGLLAIEANAGKAGTHRYRLILSGDNLSPRQSVTGDTGVGQGVTPVSPEPSLNHPSTPLAPRKRGERAHCPKHRRYRGDCTACARADRPALTAVPARGDPRCPIHAHEHAASCRSCAADRKAAQ